MRLGPFDTSQINVREGGGGLGRAGGIGCGTLVIALLGALLFGLDPMRTIGLVEGVQQQGAPAAHQGGGASEEALCSSSPYASEACAALGSLNATWGPVLGSGFIEPDLVLYPSGPVSTNGCGNASSAAGPFYCPADNGIYLDTTFFEQLAAMSGERGDFARLYVIAHEYGHHLQNVTGLAAEVRSLQQRNPAVANRLQVALELHADCLAGLWAGRNRELLEPGDFEEGMRAASAIGDDTLMRRSGQRISPENFTHGTSDQRIEALTSGMENQDVAACNRFLEPG